MNVQATCATSCCAHCGEPCKDQETFCCQGCKTVYTLLQENGLCQYYQLNEKPGTAQRAKVREDKFAFLDDSRTQQQLLQYSDAARTHVTFYIPAIHCSSCLWLLENLHRLDAGIEQAIVNFSKKETKIVYSQELTSMRKIAELLTAVGYEPYISLRDLNRPKPKANRKLVYQLGVAGFCFANIMLLSFPEYFAGQRQMEGYMTDIFRYLNLALSLPVVFYSAQAFYVPAWKSLRHGFLNIDAPIVLAIAVTFVRSLVDVISGAGGGYFDSMTGIVLFMLTGRLLQDKTYRGLSFDRDYTAYFPVAVTVLKNGEEVPTRLPDLKTGETVLIHHEELIPADGILSRGRALIDYSFVTGESVPVARQTGDIVYAGGRQLEGNIELLTIKEAAQSYLTSLWNRDDLKKEQEGKPSFIHRLGQSFSWIVLLIAASAATWWAIYDPSRIWPSVTAILIIACPCALLLAASFTNGHILRILSRHGLYLQNAQAIESLAGTTHIVFDKTGTLTGKQNTLTEWCGRPLSSKERHAVAAVASASRHPASMHVRSFCGEPARHSVSRYSEQAGYGLQGWAHGMHVQLGSAAYTGSAEHAASTPGSKTYLNINGDHAGYFLIRHAYRDGIDTLLHQLAKQYRLSLVSGDGPEESANMAAMMGPGATLCFRQQPQDKLEYILALRSGGEQVLMIGDGLNDAGALKQSNTGISLAEGGNNFTPASNGILEAGKLRELPSFIRVCKAGKRIILASFIYSITYNLAGLYFAVQGKLSPLTAAILMPVSSISIITLTYLLSEYAGRKAFR